MACTLGSVAALGGKRKLCLGPHMRLQSVPRGFLTLLHRKENEKITYHNSAKGKALSASSAPSGTRDEGRPVEAGLYRGAIHSVLDRINLPFYSIWLSQLHSHQRRRVCGQDSPHVATFPSVFHEIHKCEG